MSWHSCLLPSSAVMARKSHHVELGQVFTTAGCSPAPCPNSSKNLGGQCCLLLLVENKGKKKRRGREGREELRMGIRDSGGGERGREEEGKKGGFQRTHPCSSFSDRSSYTEGIFAGLTPSESMKGVPFSTQRSPWASPPHSILSPCDLRFSDTRVLCIMLSSLRLSYRCKLLFQIFKMLFLGSELYSWCSWDRHATDRAIFPANMLGCFYWQIYPKSTEECQAKLVLRTHSSVGRSFSSQPGEEVSL